MKIHRRAGFLALSLLFVGIQLLIDTKLVTGNGQDEIPVAAFSANDSTILKLGSVQFNDLSTGNPDSWVWILDGATPPVSYAQNPEAIYTQPGSFDVTLIVSNEFGNDSLFMHDFISVNPYPDDWTITVSATSHVISVPLSCEPDFNGNALEPGDLVGVFYISVNDTLCGAFSEWTGEGNVGVVAFEDDPTTPEKDGFAIGEEFIWVTYSYRADCNFIGTALFSMGPSYFEVNGLSVVSQLDFFGPIFLLISGGIYSQNDAPVSDVFVNFGDEVGPVLTGLTGDYSRYVPQQWSDTVSPQMEGFNFSPEFRPYYHVVANVEDQNYIATGTNIPPGWYFIETSVNHTIEIPIQVEPVIYGEPISPGDFIGVFYLNNQILYCGGYVVWTGEDDIQLIANGNDAENGEKNGFNAGDEMIWKIYSWASQFDTIATVVYDTTYQDYDGTFVPLGSSAVTEIAVLQIIYHIIDVPQGWSGISSYVDPTDDLIQNIFESIEDKLIIVIDKANIYWPSLGINTIINWNSHSGYQIKVEEEVQLVMTGFAESNKKVDVNTGWQLIPVLNESYIPSADIFEPLADTLIIAKDAVGSNVYWPELQIYTLDTLNPGKSYFLNVAEPCSITYPD